MLRGTWKGKVTCCNSMEHCQPKKNLDKYFKKKQYLSININLSFSVVLLSYHQSKCKEDMLITFVTLDFNCLLNHPQFCDCVATSSFS